MNNLPMMLGAGIASALSLYILCWKLDIRKVCGISAYADIAVTLFLMSAFEGTFSGMIAAVTGGLVFSLFLAVTRYFNGALHLVWDGGELTWRLCL